MPKIIKGMSRNRREITYFVTSFFMLLIIAKGLTVFTLWLFRFFGMPQLWEWYRQLDHPGHIRFLLVLVICTAGSVYRIWKNR